jgi:uncharacterized protein (DUF1810 family)
VNSTPTNLQRFVEAQDGIFEQALAEIRAGSKRSHWMWFIFPQIAGLGHSPASQLYGIQSIEEAREYLEHPILGSRLRKSVEAVLGWSGERDAALIFGSVDAMKLRSSLTLFALADPGEPLFNRALSAFFGSPDPLTLHLIQEG